MLFRVIVIAGTRIKPKNHPRSLWFWGNFIDMGFIQALSVTLLWTWPRIERREYNAKGPGYLVAEEPERSSAQSGRRLAQRISPAEGPSVRKGGLSLLNRLTHWSVVRSNTQNSCSLNVRSFYLNDYPTGSQDMDGAGLSIRTQHSHEDVPNLRQN